MKLIIPLIAIGSLLTSLTFAQQINYTLTDDFEMSIAGTSSLHDWESSVGEVSATLALSYGEDGTIKINSCKVSVNAGSIKSTKGAVMDKKTYKALKTEEHPNITFEMKNVVKTTNNDKGFTTEVQGVLSIAGASNTVNILVAGTETAEGFEFVGEKALKMTDFNIDPPTALFGTLKTGDDITIKFKTTFKKN